MKKDDINMVYFPVTRLHLSVFQSIIIGLEGADVHIFSECLRDTFVIGDSQCDYHAVDLYLA